MVFNNLVPKNRYWRKPKQIFNASRWGQTDRQKGDVSKSVDDVNESDESRRSHQASRQPNNVKLSVLLRYTTY